MRTFEAVLFVTLGLGLASFLLPASKRPGWLTLFPSAAIVAALIHVLVEKARWQMLDAYVLTTALFLISQARRASSPKGEESSQLITGAVFLLKGASPLTPTLSHQGERGLATAASEVNSQNLPLKGSSQASERAPRRSGCLALAGKAVGVVYFCLALAAPLLFPMFQLPEPSGPYPVGRARFQLLDSARPEAFTPDPDDRRKPLVQAWYPADPAPGAQPGAYWEDAPLLLNHLSLVQSHSYPGAPLASAGAPFPTLIFSHGYFVGFAAQNTIQMEELASHGYVVFSLAHPYDALAVTYPDGQAVYFSPEHMGAIVEALSQPELDNLLNDSLRIWTSDTLFLMDELERMNAGDRPSAFAGRLDLERIGVFGMSFGGATAGQVCLIDDRCRAGINLDGGQMGDLREAALEKPFMLMYDEQSEGMNDFVYEQAQDAVYRVTIQGSLHMDFSDGGVMLPLFKRIGALGPIDGRRMAGILNAYCRAFFDRHLQGKPAPLLDGPSPDYPEVGFQSRLPPTAR